MKVYSESLPLQASRKREAINIHSQVKAAVEKSGVREGVAVISSPDSATGVVLMQDDAGSREQFLQWLERLASAGYGTGPTAIVPESAAAMNFDGVLLGRQIALTLSESRLDLGPREAVFFIELDGVRPRRVAVKILGE